MYLSQKYIFFVLAFIVTMLIKLFINRRSIVVDKMNVSKELHIETYNFNRISFPSPLFFRHLAKYYEWMAQLQTHLDTAAKTRQGVIGNIAWHPSQLYYYARFASLDWVSTICEIGYGAGHSTVLYLSVNPKAHIYSFDLFPDNKDDRVHTPGETLVFQQAFQAVTLKAIDDDIELASRFHKIAGNSNLSIPKFIKENSHIKCDLLSIDGSHNPPQPFFDILNSQPLAHKETIVILDDMQSILLKEELKKSIQLGILKQYECLKPELRVDSYFSSSEMYDKEFCAARYLNVDNKRF